METLRPLSSVEVVLRNGIVDIRRNANSTNPESWLALNYENAKRLGLALVEAGERGKSYERAKA